MTAREQAIISIIQGLPWEPRGLEYIPTVGVARGAVRLAEALGGDRDLVEHLLTHPDHVQLPAQRKDRLGHDWHDVLVDYTTHPAARSVLHVVLP